jgi:hypothetical protein
MRELAADDGADDLAISSDGSTGTIDVVNVSLTPDDTAGLMNAFVISQADSANTNPMDAGIRINNLDANLAVTSAFQVANTGGGNYTNIFDILGTTITAAEFNVIDGGIDLGTDTAGDYVASFTAGGGLTGSGSGEGSTPTIAVGAGKCFFISCRGNHEKPAIHHRNHSDNCRKPQRKRNNFIYHLGVYCCHNNRRLAQ